MILAVSCARDDSTATPLPSATPTRTPIPTIGPTRMPTVTVAATPTPLPTATRRPTPGRTVVTATPTPTSLPTPPIPTPTPTLRPAPTATPTALPPQPAELLLEVTAPEDNIVVDTREITVTGRASPDATVTVNGQLAQIDEFGDFLTPLPVSLVAGPNLIEVIASDLDGEVRSQVITVILIS